MISFFPPEIVLKPYLCEFVSISCPIRVGEKKNPTPTETFELMDDEEMGVD